MEIKKYSLEKQAEKILELAEESGVEGNFFFVSTFQTYLAQLGYLKEMKKELDGEGMLVTKEYVKGRKNIVSNPLLIAYNNTANSAGRTLSSLLKVIDKFAIGKEKETDELASFIAGKK